MKNYEKTEDIKMKVIDGRLSYRKLTHLIRGHHCLLTLSCEQRPKLFDLLPIKNYSTPKIGLCNKENWSEIKAILIRLNNEMIEE